jgi:hypothetical protein
VTRLFIEAALALDPNERATAAEVGRHLLALLHSGVPRQYETAVPTEDVLTLGAIAGGAADQAEIAGEGREAADQPLYLIELEVIACLPVELRAYLSAFGRYRSDEMAERLRRAKGARALASNPEYATACREILEALAARMTAIHAGRIAYVAEKAAGAREVDSAIRAFEVASVEDSPWFGELVPSLLPLLVVAPNASKTVPSQSLAIGITRSTAEQPTAESVASLAEALGVVRHAGMKKKLERELRQARKALSASGRVVARAQTTGGRGPSKRDITAFRTALDASFDAEPRPFDPWLRQLLDDPAYGVQAANVIWNVGEGPFARSGLWREGRFRTANLEDFSPGASAFVRPWHPVEASPEERSAWQRLVLAEHVAQPIRQAFREWYVPAESEMVTDRTSMFARIAVSVRPFLGVARREGWRTVDQSLRRESLRGWAFELRTNFGLYPGAEGRATVDHVRVEQFTSGRWQPAVLAKVPRVLLSEVLRSVDLLMSTAALGFDDGQSGASRPLDGLEDLPITGQTKARRAMLETVLAAVPGSDRITFEARFLRVRSVDGDYRVHYGTGIVVEPSGAARQSTDDGRSVEIPLPWLPYDEALLELVAKRTLGLLAESQ